MNLSELDRRVATTFMQATLRSLGEDRIDSSLRLPRALLALAAQVQSMGLLPRDVAGPNGPEALEAIASAIFTSAAWRTQPPPRLRAEWSLVVDRAHGMAAPGSHRVRPRRTARRPLVMASPS